jgi:tRNA-specific 2-thiouridylase
MSKKVVVGMSGGVDSAVCAYLLKEEGYDVIGLTLRVWESSDGEESRCCEIDDAKCIADHIGFPFHTFNCISEFERNVTKPFVCDYIKGMTPNPCIECNRYVKWERMLYFANIRQADFVATGHYASVVKLENGRYTVKKALHAEKDQTYMLYKLSQEQLSRTLMPLGKYSKDEVREIARKAGIIVADKPDSQEICFVPDGDYANYIVNNASELIPAEGNFVDEDGKILGKHKGIIHYTIGQRKGLGIAFGVPMFVKEIRPETNEVVLSEDKALYNDEIFVNDLNFLSIEDIKDGVEIPAKVKIRYRHDGENAILTRFNEDTLRIVFEKPVRAATAGQSAVFYDENDCVIGGGKIIRKTW